MATIGGWTTHRAPDGREYWFNTVTRQSTYDKPEELKSAAEKAIGVTAWKEYSNQGRKYYFNTVTKESKWDAPPEYKDWLEKITRVRQEEAKQSPQPAQQGFAPLHRPGPGLSPGPGHGQQLQNAATAHTQQLVLGASSPVGVQNNVAPVAVAPVVAPVAVHEFRSRMEADVAFRELLSQREVGPDWTWEQTMRELVTDPTYKGLRNWIDKRAVWEHYVGEIKEKRDEERKKRVEKLVSSIGEMMRKSSKTRSYMSYYTAKEVFKGNSFWESAKDESERVVAFDEIIAELKKAESEKAIKVRKETMDGFGELLKGCEIDVMTSWQDALKRVRSLPDFEEDQVMKEADLLDLFMVFEEMMKELEREQVDKRQNEKDDRRRQARKARESYIALLTELKLAGVLTATTQWEEIVPLLSEEDRFHAIVGQPGSTALELFLDIREELQAQLDQDAEQVQSYLTTQGHMINRNTVLADFQTWIGESSDLSSRLDEGRLEEVFSFLHARVMEKSIEEVKEEERQHRHRMEDFRYRLKKIVPDLEIDLDLDLNPDALDDLPTRREEPHAKLNEVDKVVLSLWREVEPKMSETEEYKALASSPKDLLLSFIKFCRRQQEKSRDRLRELKRKERERHRSRRLSEERRMASPQAANDADRLHHPPPSRRPRASDVLQYD